MTEQSIEGDKRVSRREDILGELARLEKERGMTVLYAAESGSRAWGFASPDSDWDVRFIYAHPREWYRAVDAKKDTIDGVLVDDGDYSGWELRKTLKLFRKSNLNRVRYFTATWL